MVAWVMVAADFMIFFTAAATESKSRSSTSTNLKLSGINVGVPEAAETAPPVKGSVYGRRNVGHDCGSTPQCAQCSPRTACGSTAAAWRGVPKNIALIEWLLADAVRALAVLYSIDCFKNRAMMTEWLAGLRGPSAVV